MQQGSDMFLAPIEIAGLTHRVRRAAQVRMLRHMGIQHKVRADGTVAVLREHVNSEFGAAGIRRTPKAAPTPNWDAI